MVQNSVQRTAPRVGGTEGQHTVLLIDDEQVPLQLRKLVLENRGFRVLSAEAPDAALDLFRRNDVDIVVTDHLLGRETAAGLAFEMKRLKPYVSIISLSGTTNVDEALKYADEFITKGEGPEQLISTLERVLRRTAEISAASRVTTPSCSDVSTVQALLAAIVEDSSDAILSKSLDGVVTTWNHAAELMYGYTRDEIVGKSVTILLPPDRPDEIKHILARLRRGERISHFETVRKTKDGRLLQVDLTISPLRDGQGRLVGASTISRDISDRKTAEDALRKAEKLALAGRMAATVAHEINNPLEAIANIHYLLLNTQELNPSARKYVEAAQEEVKRVSEIVRLTLGMQRGATATREAVKITGLLDDLLTIYQRKLKSLRVEVQKDYEYDAQVIGSPGELRQVFSNLIVNAMDALAITGDRLVIRVSRGHRWNTGESGVRVLIGDNGPGIPPEVRAQIFQAFYTTKGDHGTGIGLWVTKDILRRHAGSLRLRSIVGAKHGTCFSVFLPDSSPSR